MFVKLKHITHRISTEGQKEGSWLAGVMVRELDGSFTIHRRVPDYMPDDAVKQNLAKGLSENMVAWLRKEKLLENDEPSLAEMYAKLFNDTQSISGGSNA